MEEMGTSSLHNGGSDKLPKREKAPRRCCRRKTKHESEQTANSSSAAPPQSDLTEYGHLGIDEYYKQRTMEVLHRMKKQARLLTFQQGMLESFVLLFGTLGVLLATFDQTELAMICVSLEKFHALSTRLDAANAGERDMTRP
ncbi:unnamed protein product [Effrenium voratum]|nr:unnamed protein product [Effrenium voratum]